MEQEEIIVQLKKHLKVWRVAAWVMLVLFACAITGVILLLFQDEKNKKGAGDVSTTPVVQNRFADPQAEEHILRYTTERCTIGSEKLLGWQYITFTYRNGFQVLVRNEYPPEETAGEKAMSVLLRNDSGIVECRNRISEANMWDLPDRELFNFSNNDYLIFRNSNGTYGFINTTTLEEAVDVNLEDVVRAYFETEDVGESHVSVKAGGAKFTFRSDVHTISFKGFTVTDENRMLRIATPVCLGDGEFIGYFDGLIVPGGNRFTLLESKFGAYVGMDYEDPESTKIIEPSTEPLENPIILSATGQGRYYLPRYQNVTTHSYNWDNLIIKDNGFRELYDDDGNKISKMGIDVSRYNNDKGDIDWKKVKESGIEFVIVKVAGRGSKQGTISEDVNGRVNVQGAAAAGLDVGVYFYTQAINEAEAVEEAEFLIGRLKEYGTKITLPVVIDTELYEANQSARGNLISRAQRTKCLVAFCEVIEKAGYMPMVYASTRWSVLNYDRDALARYPFWFAYYGEHVSYRFEFDIWQYTSEGRVPGITGDVDLDIMLTEPYMRGN